MTRIAPRAALWIAWASGVAAVWSPRTEAEDAGGFRIEIDNALGTEADDIVAVLPAAVDCVVTKQPERCGIAEFAVGNLTEAQLRARFSGDVAVVSPSGRAQGEIRVEFPQRGNGLGGVIYFRRKGGVLSPVYVTLAVP